MDPGLKRQIRVLKIAFFRNLHEDGFYFRHLRRFGDVVECAQANRLNGRFHAGMAGHHHRLGVGRDAFQMLEHLDPADAGHPQVQNGRVKTGGFHSLQRQPAVCELGHIVTHSGQLGAHDLAQAPLIINKQNPQFSHAAPLGLFRPPVGGP